MQRVQKLGTAGDGGGGQIAGGDQPSLAVNIGQNQFQEPRALLDALRDLAPFAGFDEQRHMRERPGTLAGIPIGAIGDARVANMPVRPGEAAAHIVGGKLHELVEKPQPMRARAPVGTDEFVWDAGQRHVAGGELSHACGRVTVFIHPGRRAAAHLFLLVYCCLGRKDFRIAASVSSVAAPMRSRQ